MTIPNPSSLDCEALRTICEPSETYYQDLQERESATFQGEYWRVVRSPRFARATRFGLRHRLFVSTTVYGWL